MAQELDPTEWGVGAMAANFDEEVPMMEGEGTARVALLDMDWEHVRALDILMVLRSFLAEVRCFPSTFLLLWCWWGQHHKRMQVFMLIRP